MDKILIKGGNELHGTAIVPSAKNACLPILAGCILCEEEVEIENCPHFSDIENMCKILQCLGGEVNRNDKNLIINCSRLSSSFIPTELASLIRSSIFSLGSIIGRNGYAKVAYPGGCEIGARPIDLHIKGLEALNVKISDKHGYITCDGTNLRGGKVALDFPSVGATENIMMAAVKAKGISKIINAAKEPEIVDLANFLNLMGAKISGAGTSEITIEGVDRLSGGKYKPIPDRIVAGTYLLAVAICGGNVKIENFEPKHNQALIEKLQKSGLKIVESGNSVNVLSTGRLKSINKIETSPFPGFATDLQPQITAFSCISKGTTVICENLFETRFKHANELIKMGANIIQKDRTIIVHGCPKLFGAEVNANDLRGGAALILAGLAAEGYTTINGAHHIDRGYENIEETFAKLGANIKRI